MQVDAANASGLVAPPAQKELTPEELEEQKKLAMQKIAEIKRKKAEEEERLEKEREMNRRVGGKQMADAKQKVCDGLPFNSHLVK
jgi:predicted DNA binding CopG/RHH family protein